MQGSWMDDRETEVYNYVYFKGEDFKENVLSLEHSYGKLITKNYILTYNVSEMHIVTYLQKN